MSENRNRCRMSLLRIADKECTTTFKHNKMLINGRSAKNIMKEHEKNLVVCFQEILTKNCSKKSKVKVKENLPSNLSISFNNASIHPKNLKFFLKKMSISEKKFGTNTNEKNKTCNSNFLDLLSTQTKSQGKFENYDFLNSSRLLINLHLPLETNPINKKAHIFVKKLLRTKDEEEGDVLNANLLKLKNISFGLKVNEFENDYDCAYLNKETVKYSPVNHEFKGNQSVKSKTLNKSFAINCQSQSQDLDYNKKLWKNISLNLHTNQHLSQNNTNQMSPSMSYLKLNTSMDIEDRINSSGTNTQKFSIIDYEKLRELNEYLKKNPDQGFGQNEVHKEVSEKEKGFLNCSQDKKHRSIKFETLENIYQELSALKFCNKELNECKCKECSFANEVQFEKMMSYNALFRLDEEQESSRRDFIKECNPVWMLKGESDESFKLRHPSKLSTQSIPLSSDSKSSSHENSLLCSFEVEENNNSFQDRQKLNFDIDNDKRKPK